MEETWNSRHFRTRRSLHGEIGCLVIKVEHTIQLLSINQASAHLFVTFVGIAKLVRKATLSQMHSKSTSTYDVLENEREYRVKIHL